MLYRKIESLIHDHLTSNSEKVLLIDGSHQIGKSYIIRHVGKNYLKTILKTISYITFCI